jgi:hypothetical protein
VAKLTGASVMDRHTASHWLPLMDLRAGAWSPRFADGVAEIERLPRLGWSDEVAGAMTRAAAAETGLRPGTPVAVGTVDALAEAISVGVVAGGELMIMYGSTTFFILVTERPHPDPGCGPRAARSPGQYALAAGTATSGSLTAWFKDTLLGGEADFATLFEEAARVPAGAGGLLALPYFSGERTPILDPDARGVIAGLSLAHGRGHVFRALLEGVGYASATTSRPSAPWARRSTGSWRSAAAPKARSGHRSSPTPAAWRRPSPARATAPPSAMPSSPASPPGACAAATSRPGSTPTAPSSPTRRCATSTTPGSRATRACTDPPATSSTRWPAMRVGRPAPDPRPAHVGWPCAPHDRST